MKKLIIFFLFFIYLNNNAFAQRYPSLDDSIWRTELYGKGAWDYTFNTNGTCKFGYHDIWYSEFTDCRWSKQDSKIKIYGNQGWPIGKWTVEGDLTKVNYTNGTQSWEIVGKKVSEKGEFYPFKIEAKYISKWIEVEVPRPKIEPRVENKVTEKYTAPKISANEPIRGREKAKEVIAYKFDSALIGIIGGLFGMLVLFGVDSISGRKIEKKFNLKIAYGIAFFAGWMFTKFI